jgi:Zn-dependent M28 family amino/carboxypeptidase
MAKLLVKKNHYSYPPLDIRVSNLRDTVEFLTTIRPYRNYCNIPSLEKTADYIQEHFAHSGLVTERQYFEAMSKTYCNIIGTWGDTHQKRVIVGAHYDVCGDQPGADDNASAVAGLLEIARLIQQSDVASAYRFDFVAYCLEEPPFFASEQMGSYVHAQTLHEQGIVVRAMICLEMIGYYTSEEHSQEYPLAMMKMLYPSTGHFIAIVGNIRSGHLVDELVRHFHETSLPVESLKAPTLVAGVGFSDHRNFWQFGYPAVMITDTAFYRNQNYHQIGDTIDTLDFDKMGEVVKGVTWSLLNLE